MFPSFPPWNGLHPLVIHFPVVLILVAPLFIVLGIIFRKRRQGFLWSAMVLMALGAGATFFAVATGEAGAEIAAKSPAVIPVLERHEELAETTRIIFTAMSLVYLAILLLLSVREKKGKPVGPTPFLLIHLIFLLLYLAGTLVLIQTADKGAHLVHEFGIHAVIPPLRST